MAATPIVKDYVRERRRVVREIVRAAGTPTGPRAVRLRSGVAFIGGKKRRVHLYVEIAPQIGQSVGWARGARRSPLGEQGLLLDCTAKYKTPLSPHLSLRTDTRARGPHLQVRRTQA